MEKWRVAMNNLTDLYLSGHSLGAYIVANYAVKYPQHVKKLQLVSPVGVTIKPKGYDNAAFDKLFEAALASSSCSCCCRNMWPWL